LKTFSISFLKALSFFLSLFLKLGHLNILEVNFLRYARLNARLNLKVYKFSSCNI